MVISKGNEIYYMIKSTIVIGDLTFSTRLFPFWKQSLLATVRYAICIFCKLHICMKHLLHLNSSIMNYHNGLCKTCTSPSEHHPIRLCSQNIMFREHNLQPLEFKGLKLILQATDPFYIYSRSHLHLRLIKHRSASAFHKVADT